MIRNALFAGCFLGCLTAPLTVFAQECPFPDSAAVVDTLDPAGYYPLGVGDSWDYVIDISDYPSPEIRRTVQMDTVVHEVSQGRVLEVDYVAVIGGGVQPVDSSYTFETVVDGVLLARDESHDSLTALFDLGAAFQSCVTVNGRLHIVRGGYGREAVLWGPDTLNLAARKEIEVGRRSVSFGHGAGLLHELPTQGASPIDLAGYTINGNTRGATLDSIFAMAIGASSNEAPILSSEVVVYPNPIRDVGWVQFDLPSPASVELAVIDVLGRQFTRRRSTTFFSQGRQAVQLETESYSPGLYLVNLLVDGAMVGSTKFVVIRP